MKCKNGHEVSAGQKFCPECGEAVVIATECPNGHTVAAGQKFCPECGEAIVAVVKDPKGILERAFAFPKNSLASIRKGIDDIEWEEVAVALVAIGLDNLAERRRYATKEEIAEMVEEAVKVARTDSETDDEDYITRLRKWGHGAKSFLDKIDEATGLNKKSS